MLRVRAEDGRTIVVEKPLKYVEILDKKGDVAMVFYKEQLFDQESVTVIRYVWRKVGWGDKRFLAYARTNGS